MISTILTALFIACCRITDVSIGTLRTILVVQGRKYYAALAGFFEVLIWISVMSVIVNKLDNPINLIAYAFGFSIGNLLGITLDEKISFGYLQLTIFSPNHYRDISNLLQKNGYGITLIPAHGIKNNYEVIITIIHRKKIEKLISTIKNIDQNCFYTVQYSKPHKGFFPTNTK
ncbi:MAG TPA: DUF5698 domain-containing protein [Ignavibacteriales bacterium]|nr:DUF5698 domain-containing protein [Ignavibacteriales bacterium]